MTLLIISFMALSASATIWVFTLIEKNDIKQMLQEFKDLHNL